MNPEVMSSIDKLSEQSLIKIQTKSPQEEAY